MSLMDKVFDVRAALKDTPEEEDFASIEAKLWEWENAAAILSDELHTLKRALAIVGSYYNGHKS